MHRITRSTFLRTAGSPSSRLSVSKSRLLSSTQSLARDEQPSLAQNDAVGHEAASVKHLINLGRRLYETAGSSLAPQRLRGIGYWSDQKQQEGEDEAAVQEQSPLPPAPETRRMAESFVSYDLLFEEDKKLHEIYTGAMTSIRTGRIMEDLDTLAGSVAYKHVLPDGYTTKDAHRANLYLVTAAVDRVDMLRPLDASQPENLRLSGHVSYTGSSSMEVLVRLDSVSPRKNLQDNPQAILVARFTMACRDTSTGKAKRIPALVTDSADEKALFQLGKEQKERKKAISAESLELQPPNIEESQRLHTLFVNRKDLYDPKTSPSWAVKMKETELTSAILAHPQERNVHGKIFGGYLMRMAYENAFCSACLFARNRVNFLALDELVFKQPVDVGKLIHMRSRVTFSPTELDEHHTFQVSVDVETVDVSTGDRKATNTFHWTFHSDKKLDRMALPDSYEEGLEWLGSMRRRAIGKELRKLYGTE